MRYDDRAWFHRFFIEGQVNGTIMASKVKKDCFYKVNNVPKGNLVKPEVSPFFTDIFKSSWGERRVIFVILRFREFLKSPLTDGGTIGKWDNSVRNGNRPTTNPCFHIVWFWVLQWIYSFTHHCCHQADGLFEGGTKCFIYPQGFDGLWKTSKVITFNKFIFQAWKIMVFKCHFWKVMENKHFVW